MQQVDQSIIATAVAAVRIYAESHPRPSHVTIGQAAEMLGISRPTVNRLLKTGALKFNECGRIPVIEIDRVLAAR